MDRRPEPELMDIPDEARVYARARFATVNQAFVDRLMELAGDRQDLKAVDIGTGPAAIPVLIAKARPTWHITAVDAARAMLLVAQVGIKMSGLADRVKIHQADAKSTGLPTAAFDVIICNRLLHHMPDPTPLWVELKRLAAPGAILFLRDLMRPDSEDEARAIVDAHAKDEPPLLKDEFFRSLLSAFRMEEVRDQLSAAGLKFQVESRLPGHLDVFGTV